MSIETEATAPTGDPTEQAAAAAAEEATSVGAGNPAEETEEVEIGFAPDPGETPEEDATDEGKPAPEWVKNLRKTTREQARRIKELEGKLQSKDAPAAPVELPKPTLEDCEFDPDTYERKLLEWNESKRKADQAKEKEEEARQEAAKAWQKKLEHYAQRKSEIKAADVEEAEAEVTHALNQVQQGIIVQYADNPAALIYALGKHEGHLKDLASITDPILFAFKLRELEAKVTKTTKKLPTPDTPLRATGGAGIKPNTLEELRAEAEKTGDYSKVVAWKRQNRETSK